MPIGARRREAWIVIPKCPFVVKSGWCWCSFVSHDDYAAGFSSSYLSVGRPTALVAMSLCWLVVASSRLNDVGKIIGVKETTDHGQDGSRFSPPAKI